MSQRPWVRALFIAASALVLFSLSWWMVGILLASNRGFDLTDEGLYLLAADPPSAQAAWGFPWGWQLRGVFTALGYDIASLRTLGGVTLVGLSGWLGWSAARVVLSPARTDLPGMWRRRTLVVVTLAGALTSLLYYAPMLRTPSYNWLNLVGLVGASACALTFAGNRVCEGGRPRRASFLLWITLSAFFLFLTVPAKPISALFLWIASAIIVQTSLGWRSAAIWAVVQPLSVFGWLLFSIATGWWPKDFPQPFLLALAAPRFQPSLTLGTSLGEVFNIPSVLLDTLLASRAQVLLVFFAGLFTLLAAVIWGRALLPARLTGVILSGVSLLAIAGVPVPGLRVQWNPMVWAHTPLAVAAVGLLLVSVLASWRLGERTLMDETPIKRSQISTAVLLLAIPGAFAIGSNNGLLAQSAGAMGVVMIGCSVVVLRRRMNQTRFVLLGAVAAVAMSFTVSGILSGWQFPYRTAPFSQAVIPTPIGIHGSYLMLGRAEHDQVAGLRHAAEALGWKQGFPMVDVSDSWHPGLVYALGARVPDSLMLTIFSYPGSVDIAEFNIATSNGTYPFKEAWRLVSAPTPSDELVAAQISKVSSDLDAATGLRFPDDYCGLRSLSFDIWRPSSTVNGTEPCIRPKS